jgi:hypothetical protein
MKIEEEDFIQKSGDDHPKEDGSLEEKRFD